MEKAIELLREKGLGRAQAKKSGRIAAEGIVYAYVDEAEKVGVVIEVNAETDFVAKNDEFQNFVADLARKRLPSRTPLTVEALLACKAARHRVYCGGALLREKILTIGENMKIRRFARYEGEVVTYSHGGGRIGVMVKFDAPADIAAKDGFKAMAKDVAMQVAAANPTYLDKAGVPADEIAQGERDPDRNRRSTRANLPISPRRWSWAESINTTKRFACWSSLSSKMVTSLFRKYIENCAKELGGEIKAVSFVRFEKGERLGKKRG